MTKDPDVHDDGSAAVVADPVSGVDLDVPAEAARLLAAHGGEPGLTDALDHVARQFQVLQTRSQLLLTLGTITLTITGFSGPRMAASGAFARYSLSLGLVLVLSSLIMVLAGSLRVHWVTQFGGRDATEVLERALRYRDRKTRFFTIELTVLIAGLSAYVSGVVSYLLTGFD